MPDEKCPDCGKRMIKSSSYMSGNSRFVEWECDDCGRKDTKCLGLRD